MKIRDLNLTRPAILLGNGLNNHCFLNCSWLQLILQLADKPIPKSLFENGGLNYPEFFDALAFENKKGYPDYNSLKHNICKTIVKWEGTSGHSKLTAFARENQIPIITTNYDLTLVDDRIRDRMKMKKSQSYESMKPRMTIISRRGFSDFYPWHTCYSDDEINHATSQFAIWHMHGIACYQRSLSIGAIDYGNNISRYKYYLKSIKKLNDEDWIGKNSWLEVFFHCDLLIIGLSLDSQETSLRWLLMEREKFYRKYPMARRKTIFILNKKYDTLYDGKRFFLKSLEIDILEVENGNVLYEEWEA